MIKIVGIDPGLAGTGIGLIQGDKQTIQEYSFGAISTSARESTPSRLHKIYVKTHAFLVEQQPDCVIIEDIYSLEKYPGSGIMLGKVSGVIMLAAHDAGIDVEEIPVREVKKIITGNGAADKHQLERAVRNILKHDTQIRPFHASDALGLAIIGYYRNKDCI